MAPSLKLPIKAQTKVLLTAEAVCTILNKLVGVVSDVRSRGAGTYGILPNIRHPIGLSLD